MMETISLFGCSFQSSHFSFRGRCQLSYVSRMCFTLLLFITIPHKSKKLCTARTFGPHLINFTMDGFWLESQQFRRLKLSSPMPVLSLSLTLRWTQFTDGHSWIRWHRWTSTLCNLSQISLFCRRRKWRTKGLCRWRLRRLMMKPTYVVLVVSQHWTKGHKILCWRCCASTEIWGIFRPQKGRQR